MDPQRLLAQSQEMLRRYQQQLGNLADAVARGQGNLAILEQRRAEKKQQQAEQEMREVGTAGGRQVLRKKRK